MVILCGGTIVGRCHVSVDGCWDAAAVLVVVSQGQVEQTGAGGQVDVLDVLYV